MTRRIRSLLAVPLLWLPASNLFAQPTITAINDSTLPRSGRLSIQGTDFGTARGVVQVAGEPALVSTWKDTRIVAYVPEAAALGATTVVVADAAAQASNAVPLNVTLRPSDGRIRWIFEIDSEYIYYRPAQAPDGTLYVHGYTYEAGGEGKVYALAPDGALKWITEVNWAADVPPAAGPDGAVYVGSISTLTRIGPDGVIDWTFDGNGIQSSAVVGPDGTVYTGFELDPEAVALDPATGDLIWATSPGLSAFGTGGNEARLGRSSLGGPLDRLYLWWDALAAFDLNGNHLFTTSAGNIYDHEVAVGSDGTLYSPANFESDLVAMNPFDGAPYWVVDQPWRAGTSDVEIGPDDTLYFVSDGRWIDAFDPSTQTSIWRHDMFHWLRRPALSPDGSILLASGGGGCAAQQGCVISFIKAFETTGGEELWHLELNEVWDPDYRNIPWDHARFSADSTTAYFTGTVAGSYDYLDERSLLWAIDLEDRDLFSDGFESGDASAWDAIEQ